MREGDNVNSSVQQLASCPDKPNCVSSQAVDRLHQVLPLSYSGEPATAMQRLRSVIESMRGTKVVSAGADALRAEFKSAVLGFVDDVDCLLDAKASVIHIRSASRLGYYDFGVNRKRVEAIRAAFDAAAK
jgi:uncharacterized protein (DUF1499 family)